MDTDFLKNYMELIPNAHYCSVKEEIIKRCFISKYVWKNWLNGRTAIPELAKPIIKEVVGNYLGERFIINKQLALWEQQVQ